MIAVYKKVKDFKAKNTAHKVVAFDLDGTLAESKSTIDNEMTLLIQDLLRYKKVAVISGGSLAQYKKQFLSKLKFIEKDLFKNLFLIPTDGASFYKYEKKWQEEYALDFDKTERAKIIKEIKSAFEKLIADKVIDRPKKLYGAQIEDRHAQITFSGLGQKAPLSAKDKWDPDQEKRKSMIKLLNKTLIGFSIKMGGMTSIDITQKGVDKNYGLKHLLGILKLKKKDLLYIGDALYDGGNDEVVLKMGVEAVMVKSVADTKLLISKILKSSKDQDKKQLKNTTKKISKSSIKPKTEIRPWGSMRSFEQNEKVSTKIIYIKKGEELSLQKHKLRSEFWKVLKGNPKIIIGKLTKDAKPSLANPGDEFRIRIGEQHQILAPKNNVEILEITEGTFLDQDIVRLSDKYHRDDKVSNLKTKKSNTEIGVSKILEKHINNPIITPSAHLDWEAKASFNPAALYHNGQVHLVYRATGNNDVSVLGYLKSCHPHTFDNDTKEKILHHGELMRFKKVDKRKRKIFYSSGGGEGGGSEDPRITKIGDVIYLIYTAFDGWGSLRLALTSLSVQDFENKNWNWEAPVLISPPNQIHKNWVLFPEKINGKFAILHGINLWIMIDYIDDLKDLDGDNFVHSVHDRHPLWHSRNKLVRGSGPTPIKTNKGWLILYHGMEKGKEHQYRLYAMLLDINDPTKILARSKSPILEPQEEYENSGLKGGIIYCCGAVVIDNILHIYYGAADTVTCLATADLDKFLEDLTTNSSIIVEKRKLKIKKSK